MSTLSAGFVHDFDKAFGHVLGFPLYWYGACYTVGFLGVFGWFALRRRRLGWSMATVLDFSIAVALGALVGGRVFDILVYELPYYRANPLHALDWWRGGLASHGVLLGGAIGVLVVCRLRNRRFVQVADEVSVPAAFLLGIGRTGNFIEGGVIGFATGMPWGVHYPDVAGPRHPVALYESVKNLLLVPVLVLVLRRYPAGRGVAMALFVLLYATLRFLTDLFRDYETYWLGIGRGQYFNLIMAGIGLALLLWAIRRPADVIEGSAVDPARGTRIGWLRPVAFACLCLYPLGIPTSWTATNIHEKRGDADVVGGVATVGRLLQEA